LRDGENVLETRPQAQLRSGKPKDEVWVIYAGTLGEHYDIQTILEAGEILKTRGSKVKIRVAGDGPLRGEMLKQIESRKLDNVIYLGVLGSDALWDQYRVSDLAICPYSGESTVAMPVKVYDYFAAGLPVVNSLAGELEKLIRDHGAGLQYQGGNAQSLSDAIEAMACRSAQLKEMSQNSHDLAARFDKSTQYQKLSEFVELVVSRFRRAPPVTIA